jgi:hypothetical protein
MNELLNDVGYQRTICVTTYQNEYELFLNIKLLTTQDYVSRQSFVAII